MGDDTTTSGPDYEHLLRAVGRGESADQVTEVLGSPRKTFMSGLVLLSLALRDAADALGSDTHTAGDVIASQAGLSRTDPFVAQLLDQAATASSGSGAVRYWEVDGADTLAAAAATAVALVTSMVNVVARARGEQTSTIINIWSEAVRQL